MRGIEKRIASLEEKAERCKIPAMTVRVVFEGLPESEDLIFHIGEHIQEGLRDEGIEK